MSVFILYNSILLAIVRNIVLEPHLAVRGQTTRMYILKFIIATNLSRAFASCDSDPLLYGKRFLFYTFSHVPTKIDSMAGTRPLKMPDVKDTFFLYITLNQTLKF